MNQALSFPRKMPIGIQSFEYIRQNDFMYVDKTEFVYRLATMGKPYFLSRPRRFGRPACRCLGSERKYGAWPG